MKVLLVGIHSKYIHSSLSLWYLKSAIGNLAETEVIEATINGAPDPLIEQIASHRADVIAFSSYIWNITYIREILPKIKELCPSAKILLGGPEVSYRVEEIFKNFPEVDYIISGEGEVPIVRLIESLKGGSLQNLKEIVGLCTKEHISPPYTGKDEPLSPYTEQYFSALKGRIVYIETSRGCPYRCAYCLSGRLGGVRFFDMDSVKRHIDLLSACGTQTIKFVDRTFNCHDKRACEIMRYIAEKNRTYSGLCYHFEMAGDIMSDELIEILTTAPHGLFQIEVGIQSFHDKTLEAIDRKTDLDRVFRDMDKIIKAGRVHVHMDLIAGLPLETWESFREGFNRLFSLSPHMLQLGFLKLLHGTPLKERYVGEFKNTPPYEVIETPYMSKSDLEKLNLVEDALERLYNSGRFTDIVKAALSVGRSPFDLFLDFGTSQRATQGEPLNEYTSRVLDYFGSILGYDEASDIMTRQWLSTNSSGKLPTCLNKGGMRKLLAEIDNALPKESRRQSGTKRSAARLSTGEIIYIDYINKNPVTGKYKIHTL